MNESNAYGNTPLHVACYNGQDVVVNELLDCGANVNQVNERGFSPLHFAAASTHGALCLELLVCNGADVNIKVRDIKFTFYALLDFHVCVMASSNWIGGSLDTEVLMAHLLSLLNN